VFKICINKPDHIAICTLTKFIDKLMEIDEDLNTKINVIPGQIYENNTMSTLLENANYISG